MRQVRVFVAQGCHLCDAALEVMRAVQADHPFAIDVVDITGDDTLEAAYRTLIPVIEVDGQRAFTYHVTPDGLRERLR